MSSNSRVTSAIAPRPSGTSSGGAAVSSARRVRPRRIRNVYDRVESTAPGDLLDDRLARPDGHVGELQLVPGKHEPGLLVVAERQQRAA
jgi:hypothetical protein